MMKSKLALFVGILSCVVAFEGPARAEGTDCSKPAGTIPTATAPIPIEHVIIIMQENRSFDTYLGRLNAPEYYGSEIDGVTTSMTNPDRHGNPVHAFHQQSFCMLDTNHAWNYMHIGVNGGKNDGWVRANGPRVMGYYDASELSYYYALANQFAVGDRYFASVTSQTFPNRYFMLAATAFGHIRNDIPLPGQSMPKSIFDTLTDGHVNWKSYATDESYLQQLFPAAYRRNRDHAAKIGEFETDIAAGRLPQVAFLDSDEGAGEDEHPPSDVRIGQAWVANKIELIMNSPYWKNSAIFLVYDENGAMFDHVAPPQACVPDATPPMLLPGSFKAGYDTYGSRVPMIAISPFAKHHYVSHTVYDHTSLLKFLETKFKLPALTKRDANANDMLDLFDFERPNFEVKALPSAPSGDRACKAVGD